MPTKTDRSALAEGVLDEMRVLADRARYFSTLEAVADVSPGLLAATEARAFLYCLDMLNLLDQEDVSRWYAYIAGECASPA